MLLQLHTHINQHINHSILLLLLSSSQHPSAAQAKPLSGRDNVHTQVLYFWHMALRTALVPVPSLGFCPRWQIAQRHKRVPDAAGHAAYRFPLFLSFARIEPSL